MHSSPKSLVELSAGIDFASSSLIPGTLIVTNWAEMLIPSSFMTEFRVAEDLKTFARGSVSSSDSLSLFFSSTASKGLLGPLGRSSGTNKQYKT